MGLLGFRQSRDSSRKKGVMIEGEQLDAGMHCLSC